MEEHLHPDLLDEALTPEIANGECRHHDDIDLERLTRCPQCLSARVRLIEPGGLFKAVCLWCGAAWW